MTLQNLLAIHRLQEHQADAGAIVRLLEAARRNLADAHITTISAVNDATLSRIALGSYGFTGVVEEGNTKVVASLNKAKKSS